MEKILSEITISEGRDIGLIDLITTQISEFKVEILDVNSNQDHNRTRFTLRGEADELFKVQKVIAAFAIENIDMSKHTGVHGRFGAVDLIYFISQDPKQIEILKDYAKKLGECLSNMDIPVYYYNEIDDDNLSTLLRLAQYEELREKLQEKRVRPDLGPGDIDARRGVTVIGIRKPYLALNINFDTKRSEPINRIANLIKSSTGGFAHVKALVTELHDISLVQLSINISDFKANPVHVVYELVKREAEVQNIHILNTEFIGPIPLEAMEDLLGYYLKLSKKFNVNQFY